MPGRSLEKIKAELLDFLKEKAYRRGKFILSSGKRSSYYIDARAVTLSAKGAYLVAQILLKFLKEEFLDCLAGPSIGADPILGAVAAMSYSQGKPLNTLIVRKEPKSHGKKKLIEGPVLKSGSKVVVVDDVVTTGESTLRAIRALRSQGYKVDKAIAVIDRLQGAKENLKKENCKLISIFTIKDFKRD